MWTVEWKFFLIPQTQPLPPALCAQVHTSLRTPSDATEEGASSAVGPSRTGPQTGAPAGHAKAKGAFAQGSVQGPMGTGEGGGGQAGVSTGRESQGSVQGACRPSGDPAVGPSTNGATSSGLPSERIPDGAVHGRSARLGWQGPGDEGERGAPQGQCTEESEGAARISGGTPLGLEGASQGHCSEKSEGAAQTPGVTAQGLEGVSQGRCDESSEGAAQQPGGAPLGQVEGGAVPLWDEAARAWEAAGPSLDGVEGRLKRESPEAVIVTS